MTLALMLLALPLAEMRSQDWTAVMVISWIALVGLVCIAVGMGAEDEPRRR